MTADAGGMAETGAGHFATTEYVEQYRGADWPETVETRRGWRVVCPTCGPLSDGYAHARLGPARGVATKHRHAAARRALRNG